MVFISPLVVMKSLEVPSPSWKRILEMPIRNIVPNLVYAGSGHEVKTVIVAGKVLVCDGEVMTADEDTIRAEAQMQAEALSQRVAADPVHKGMALLKAMETDYL